jgi:hypothetical protein
MLIKSQGQLKFKSMFNLGWNIEKLPDYHFLCPPRAPEPLRFNVVDANLMSFLAELTMYLSLVFLRRNRCSE